MQTDEEREVLALTVAGYMFKQGGTRKSWKKRYFELTEGCINYYKTDEKTKLKGTLYLTEGWGVRAKRDCKCDWPSGTLPSKCFGLAMKERTYYFYTTDDAGLEEWAETVQNVINVIGEPNDDPSKDHKGKPEGNKSKIARSAASLGAKATKVAIKYAPVDDTVKELVSAGADIVSDQVEADPNASVADRLQIAAGTADGICDDDDEDGNEIVEEVTKEIGKAIKKNVTKPKAKAPAKAMVKASGGAKLAGKATKGAGKAASSVTSKSTTSAAEKATGKAAASAGKGLAKGASKGIGKMAKKK